MQLITLELWACLLNSSNNYIMQIHSRPEHQAVWMLFWNGCLLTNESPVWGSKCAQEHSDFCKCVYPGANICILGCHLEKKILWSAPCSWKKINKKAPVSRTQNLVDIFTAHEKVWKTYSWNWAESLSFWFEVAILTQMPQAVLE